MSDITLSKQLVCGVSLAYTVNVWLFSNELGDKLDAGGSCGITGWEDTSVPYGHWLNSVAHVCWTPTVRHCVRHQSSPFDLLSDFRSSLKSHCSLLYMFAQVLPILCLLIVFPLLELMILSFLHPTALALATLWSPPLFLGSCVPLAVCSEPRLLRSSAFWTQWSKSS